MPIYWQILTTLQHFGQLFAIFSLHMRRNGYLCTNYQNSDTAIEFREPIELAKVLSEPQPQRPLRRR